VRLQMQANVFSHSTYKIPELSVLAVPFMKRAYEYSAASLLFPRLKHRTARVYVWAFSACLLHFHH
jgi:hypothetical protein